MRVAALTAMILAVLYVFWTVWKNRPKEGQYVRQYNFGIRSPGVAWKGFGKFVLCTELFVALAVRIAFAVGVLVAIVHVLRRHW